MNASPDNIHLYPTSFTNETRILRITKTLKEWGIFNSILIYASLNDPKLSDVEVIDDGREVVRIKTKFLGGGLLKKILYIFEWWFKSFISIDGTNLKCVNAHSLSTLPLGVILKLSHRSKLIYDAHEIETETQEIVGLRRLLSKVAEWFLIKFVDAINLTSDGHANWYREKHPRAYISVVRNTPYRRSEPVKENSHFRDQFAIPQNEMVFLYQGSLSEPRGIRVIINAFLSLPANKHLVLMGFGPMEQEIKRITREHRNFHFREAVIPDKVFEYTSSGDVGIHMMDDSCINHLYSLPNKPMEYMNAGLPAIVSSVPQMSSLIEESKAGWIIPVGDEVALRELIVSITPKEILDKKNNAIDWASKNYWEREEQKLLDLYKRLGFRSNS